jgi:RNase P/RNase MRP subunit p29
MAKILYLCNKKRFDFVLGKYLSGYFDLKFITSMPEIYIFFKTQGIDDIDKLYSRLSDKRCRLPREDEESIKRICNNVERFALSISEREKIAFRKAASHYLAKLTALMQREAFDLAIAYDRPILDVACLEKACRAFGVSIRFIGTGFFRGDTMDFSAERLELDNNLLWKKRFERFKNSPQQPVPNMPEQPFTMPGIISPSGIVTLRTYLRYSKNPFFLKRHPNIKPARSFFRAIIHRHKKYKFRKLKPHDIEKLDMPLVFIPLQGNEICRQVRNSLNIADMEDLIRKTYNATKIFSEFMGKPFKIVSKEHPNRPGVIGKVFKSSHQHNVTFLSNADLNSLIDKASLIVTFNSLVGFEALQKGKPVVTLAPTFYSMSGMAYLPPSLERLPDVMKQAIEHGPDPHIVDKFIDMLKTHFQVETPDCTRKKINVTALHNIACHIARDIGSKH